MGSLLRGRVFQDKCAQFVAHINWTSSTTSLALQLNNSTAYDHVCLGVSGGMWWVCNHNNTN